MGDYELYHHGIKGQKWGVRRTAAQLGHRVANAASKAGKATGKALSKAGKATGKFAKKEATKAKKAAVASAKQHFKEEKEKRYYNKLHKKKLSQMTDKEIADLTKRVKAEAGLKDAKYESRMQNARKFYNNVAKEPLKTVTTVYAKEAAKKMFGDDDDGGKKEKEQKPKNQNNTSNKDNDVAVDFTVEKPKASKKPKKGSANPYNNPVIIRHGR